MAELDVVLHAVAAGQHNLITRADVHAVGGTDRHIRIRLARRQWQGLYRGVYLDKAGPPDWVELLHGAVLATTGTSVASHHSALILWGLDGISGEPLHITTSHDEHPLGNGVCITRSRRPIEPVTCQGVPVTTVERTLLDVAGCLPPVVVRKAAEAAFRRNLTTPSALSEFIEERGGRGVKGTRWLREYLLTRPSGRAAGSAAEVELLLLLEQWGVEPPVRQLEIPLSDGTIAVVDAAWPQRRKAIEVDGFAFHSSPEALAADNRRQNLIAEAGYALRRYAAVDIRRDPDGVARSVMRFVYGSPPSSQRPPHRSGAINPPPA